MRKGVFLILSLIMFTACKHVPGYVIPMKKMSEILADVHTAEAVVDMNRREYGADSSKMALKEAIFERYNVNSAQFDTSLVWYAHNMDKYIELYDMTIEKLEQRSAKVGSMVIAAAMSMAGDSVDVWGASRYVVLNDRLPSRMLTFNISADDNWEPGDVYTWRVKLIDAESTTLNWNLAANYADSTLEYLSFQTAQPGWNEVTFVADSTRQMKQLRGYVELNFNDRPLLWIDSISLVRKRVNENAYRQRHRQRAYKEYYLK